MALGNVLRKDHDNRCSQIESQLFEILSYNFLDVAFEVTEDVLILSPVITYYPLEASKEWFL